MEYSREFLKRTPKIFTRVSYLMPQTVSGAFQLPADSAVDFRGLRHAPVAFSYSWMTRSMMEKLAGEVTKIVMSSAYAMTEVGREPLPVWMLGRFCSSVRRSGS
jgi:hypothetical protein